MKYVAVDVDGTLTHSNISFAFGRFLYQKGVASFSQIVMPVLYYSAHVLGLLSVEQLHRSIFRILFSGRRKDLIEQAVDEFLALHGARLIRDSIRKELLALQQERCRIALLSSSPDFLVRKVAFMLDIEEWAATDYEVDDRGHFSAIGRIVTGEVKAQIVRQIKNHDGVIVTAMTDSMLDIPLLEEADEVVAVFPDHKLRRCAKERGWRIVNSG